MSLCSLSLPCPLCSLRVGDLTSKGRSMIDWLRCFSGLPSNPPSPGDIADSTTPRLDSRRTARLRWKRGRSRRGGTVASEPQDTRPRSPRTRGIPRQCQAVGPRHVENHELRSAVLAARSARWVGKHSSQFLADRFPSRLYAIANVDRQYAADIRRKLNFARM